MRWQQTAVGLALALSACRAAPTKAPLPASPDSALFLDGFFPIGVFSQTASNLESWRDRGCNTALEIPQGEDRATWDAEAQRVGLKLIRRPVSDPADDIGRTDVIAWPQPDEPDVDGQQANCGGDCIALCERLFTRWREVDPTRPVFVNLAGPNVLLPAACDHCNGPGDEPPSPECYPNNATCYPRIIAAADWVGMDVYPVTGWLFSDALREDVSVVGRTLDKLAGWTDKPLFAIVEVSNQRLNIPGAGTRGPTPGEYRAEVWDAIIHGARGIFYFPQAFNPFTFDATSAPVLREMERQHATLSALAPVLQSKIDPPGLTAAVDMPLEAGWRRSANSTVFFVLNTTGGRVRHGRVSLNGASAATKARVYGEGRSVRIARGAWVDDFDPFALHIYVVPDA